MIGRPRFRARTPSELADEERPVASKEILAQARDAIKGTSLENLRQSVPSFRTRGNLKALLNEKRRSNKPSAELLAKTAKWLRDRAAKLAGAADSAEALSRGTDV